MRCQVWAQLPDDSQIAKPDSGSDGSSTQASPATKPLPTLRECVMNDWRLLRPGLKAKPPAAGLYDFLLTTSGAAPPAPGKPPKAGSTAKPAPPKPDPNKDAGKADLQASFYGVLGAWALAECGQEISDSYWSAVEEGWRTHQAGDGGWSSALTADDKHPVTAAMTAAGVTTLFVTGDYLHSLQGLDCRAAPADPPLERGLAWFDAHFEDTARKSGEPFALYAVERIGVASGRKYFGKINWYEEGADRLVKKQAADGSWKAGSGGTIPGTSFGLLFLVRGRAPVAMNKLDYTTTRPSSDAQPPQWNNRPRDLAHVARWIEKEAEVPQSLNWQVVNLISNPDDWHDAPILYVAGNQAIDLPDSEQLKLKRFIENGGMALFNADCANESFNVSVHKLASTMFPSYEFRELPANHPIYTNEQFARSTWKRPPKILGLSNGVRELMILVPADDLGREWQIMASERSSNAFQFAADLLLYAMDKQNLMVKGKSYLVKADSKTKATSTMKIARLQAGGDAAAWDPEPGGWRRLAAIEHNTEKLDFKLSNVALGNGKLASGGFKLAHLTGTASFKLTDEQRQELQKYVTGGGTLLIDAAGGSPEFAQSAETELGLMYPDQTAALKEPLQSDHAIFKTADGQPIPIAYRSYARRRLVQDMKMPRLRGIDVGGGRIGVFYSAEDLSAGMVGQQVDGITGYDPAVATALVQRILAYAQTGK
jgi:hypothetical protein